MSTRTSQEQSSSCWINHHLVLAGQSFD